MIIYSIFTQENIGDMRGAIIVVMAFKEREKRKLYDLPSRRSPWVEYKHFYSLNDNKNVVEIVHSEN